MGKFVLGISGYYHDSAAALIHEGKVIAAAQEERFSRKKHDPRFPKHAINYCLGEAFIEPSELDAVVFYDNPLLTLDRAIKTSVAVAPAGRDQFIAACEELLGNKARIADDLRSVLGGDARLLVTPHHLAHAASCFFPSPFDNAAILTIDGVGEWATCSIAVGKGTRIRALRELHFPHSLGLLYSAFTQFCGFKVNSDEYKLMGLAPYGEPIYANMIRDELVDILDDGSFRLDTSAFGFLHSGTMAAARFEELFGGPSRVLDDPITRREMDLAASIQLVTEEIVLRLVRTSVELAGVNRLTLAGGVGLNCVANGRIAREAGLDGLFVQPAAGDAGGALGAALLVSHQMLQEPRPSLRGQDAISGSLLGPSFAPEEIAAFLDIQGAVSEQVPNSDLRAELIGDALSDGKVVGFFSGRMEFGPRALGSRSILADPRCPDMQRRLNLKIKFRESFRPFAPAVLTEYAGDYFELEHESPFMLLVAPVSRRRRLAPGMPSAACDELHAILSQPRSDIPAVTHVDFSARVQTVGAEANPDFRRVLDAFHARTGCPVLVNTSFNVRDEPIVCTPQDAYRCFMRTGIDLLVIEDRILRKEAQPVWPEDEDDETAVSRTNPLDGPSRLSGRLFDEALVPLALARRSSGAVPLLAAQQDLGSVSYFVAPEIEELAEEDCLFPGNGCVDAFFGLLAGRWRNEGGDDLASLTPRLKEIWTDLRNNFKEKDDSVNIFCYTMF